MAALRVNIEIVLCLSDRAHFAPIAASVFALRQCSDALQRFRKNTLKARFDPANAKRLRKRPAQDTRSVFRKHHAQAKSGRMTFETSSCLTRLIDKRHERLSAVTGARPSSC
jgi:hypothetical protein